MYVYGLFAHKLAHFFDVVHGTRHDFFMNEYKIGNNCPQEPHWAESLRNVQLR